MTFSVDETIDRIIKHNGLKNYLNRLDPESKQQVLYNISTYLNNGKKYYINNKGKVAQYETKTQKAKEINPEEIVKEILFKKLDSELSKEEKNVHKKLIK